MKKNLMRFVLGTAVLLAGVQGAFAACSGTVYFKAPSDWTQAVFAAYGGSSTKVVTTKSAEGYFVFDLSTLGAPSFATKFGISNSNTAGVSSYIVMDTVWMHQNPYDANALQNSASIPCPTSDDGVVYVSEDVFKSGKTYIGSVPQDAKYFYMLAPEERAWQADELMISYTDSKGTKKQATLMPSQDYCGWYYMVLDYVPADAVVYLKNSPDMQIGMNGLWDDDDEADPLPLDFLFDAFGVDKLFFIPDDAAWPNDDGGQGWYTAFPEVEGYCSFVLATIIYDTDESLNTAFTSDGNSVGPGACVGVYNGLVKETLGEDGKPVYSGTADAQMCFGNNAGEAESNFKALFNYVADVNEVQCYDMPFRHYGRDSRWAFLSDSIVSGSGTNKVTGGFYPLENSTDAGVVQINGVMMGPNSAARIKSEADAPVPLYDTVKTFDYYCNTPGWFGGTNCGASHLFNNGESPAVWNWGVRENWKTQSRNQQFCLQSHATFTYNEDQEFTVIGDDDIWVFINNKLAVDNGGAHLSTPGHVVLKNLNTTYGAGFLLPGADYPIDIFVCDRRKPMSNLNIKTNIFFKQSAGMDMSAKQVAGGGIQLDFCVLKSGNGDCAAVALGNNVRECGEEISTNIVYSIKTRKGENPSGCADCSALAYGRVSHGGIDLTNPKVPVIYPDKISGLGPGSYRLVIEVEGKKTHYNFRVKGNLGIVSSDVVFDNVDQEQSVYATGTKWTFVGKGLAGTRVPIYISAPDGQGGVDLFSAAGQSYTLTLSKGVVLYKSNEVDDWSVLSVPYSGKIGETGIDTLWLDVPLAGFTSAQQEVTATVGNTSAKITFYAPIVQFAEPNDKDSLGNVLSWNPVSQDPDVNKDGGEFYHWVSADVDYYVVVIDPTTGGICSSCNFPIDLLDKSDGITGQVSALNEGVALVRIRSNLEYSTEAASMVVGSTENGSIAAPYGNMHFYKPPTAMPVLVDVFDVKGAPLGEMDLPAQYYDKSADYLDGKADSIVVVYDRVISSDSLPIYICVNFDEKNLKKINPYEMGISNNSKDKELYCSTEFDADDIKKAYKNSPDGGQTLVFTTEGAFSEGIKTHVNSDNKIVAFSEYTWKGKVARTSYEKGLTDRMAPVILSAQISTEDGGKYDQLKVAVSEPVNVVEASAASEAFSYYLNSATDYAESMRYVNVTAQGAPQNGKDTLVLRYYNADSKNPTPHVGDYIRFRADKVVWADTSNGYAAGADTLRPSSDAKYYWNSPTAYDSKTRLPSPWVLVEAAKTKTDEGGSENESDFAKPSFRIKMTGPFQFAIVMDEELPARARAFAVMDLQGRVLRKGDVVSSETVVSGLSCGSYIVKVGLGTRRVNIR